jgi:hypothetical protein
MTAQQQFWNWFVENENSLFDFEMDQERVFGRLSEELEKIDQNLTFEFGPKRAGVREFIISADGVKSAFPAVSALAVAAPRLSRWEITGFRPRGDLTYIICVRSKLIDPKDVRFTLLHNGKIVGINLFIPGYDEEDHDLKQIGYLLLDQALGEFDVETKVGPINFLSPDTKTPGDRYPLRELPSLFDQLVEQLRKK